MQVSSVSSYGNEIEDRSGRVKIILDENETASYIPSLFIMPGSNLQHSISSIRSKDSGMQGIANVTEAFKEDIANHVETKIQLFFYQLLLVYRTGNKIFYDKAYYQAGAKAKKSVKEQEVERNVKHVEAHCATLPTVLVGNADEFKNCFLNEDRELTRVFLGDRTHYGLSWNMTTTLPICVNNVDSRLEWMHKEKRYGRMVFRQCCVKLLSNTSKGKIDPEMGLRQFLTKGLYFLRSITQINPASSPIHAIYISIFNKYLGLLTIDALKTLTFSVKNEKFSFEEQSKQMQEQLSFETNIQRYLSNLSQTIRNIPGICEMHTSELSLVMKGVVLRKTAAIIATWFEAYICLNALHLEKTGGQYVFQCLKSEAFVTDAREYLREKSIEQLGHDFRLGIGNLPLSGLITKIAACIGKTAFQNKLNILVHALHKVATLNGHSTEVGIRLRQILCVNDSLLEGLLSVRPKLRGAIEKASANQDVAARFPYWF